MWPEGHLLRGWYVTPLCQATSKPSLAKHCSWWHVHFLGGHLSAANRLYCWQYLPYGCSKSANIKATLSASTVKCRALYLQPPTIPYLVESSMQPCKIFVCSQKTLSKVPNMAEFRHRPVCLSLSLCPLPCTVGLADEKSTGGSGATGWDRTSSVHITGTLCVSVSSVSFRTPSPIFLVCAGVWSLLPERSSF